jgi:hypothetical protein
MGRRKGERLPDFADGEIHVIGHGIGNIRVWGSSLNKADGSNPPYVKLELGSDSSERASILKNSCIRLDHIEYWKAASGEPGRYRIWSKERALSFQTAVEHRAAWLYHRFYDELEYAAWATPSHRNDLSC